MAVSRVREQYYQNHSVVKIKQLTRLTHTETKMTPFTLIPTPICACALYHIWGEKRRRRTSRKKRSSSTTNLTPSLRLSVAPKAARQKRLTTMSSVALKCLTTTWQAPAKSERLPAGERRFFVWEQHAGNGWRLLRVFWRTRLGWEPTGLLWWTRLQRRRSPR